MANYIHKMSILTYIVLSWFVIFEFILARDNITITEFLRDPETLVSSNGMFKCGFFSPINSTNRYVGIWYNKKVDDNTMEVVWVANRETPLNHTSGVFRISRDGNLRLLDGQNNSIWSSNVARKNKVNASVAQVLDTGNLVLLSSSGGNVIWQSFDHPTDSLLPLMQVTIDGNATVRRLVASWSSASDPSSGRFTGGLNNRMLSEIFIWDGERPYWRSGPWDGTVFLGVRAMYYSAQADGFQIQSGNNGNLSLSFSSASKRVTEHYVLTFDGMGLQKDWDDDNGNWTIMWQSIESECDVFGMCGEFGSCNSNNAPICSCLKGFEPSNNAQWTAGNWSSGCVRRKPLQCETTGGNEDGFFRLTNIKVPDNAQWLDSNDEEDCRGLCLRNCSCLAYAYYLGFGCMIWNESLVDIQEFSDVGVDVFIRLANSELGDGNKWKVIIAIIVIMGTIALIAFLYCLWRLMLQRYGNKTKNKEERGNINSIEVETSRSEFQDLPLFRFEDLLVATNDFSENNKLGRGGFGSVYKGRINGQEMAVKRLSRASVQGLQEFMNEVIVISKLQHRNLVRLLGCCVEGEEKLLVYEYMPNKSLDAFLFDPSNREHLDWEKRFNIIKGISRGLLYLHRDSRLKIVHRDLKASNILLDENLNPKISDFGMARIFEGNEDQADTKRIVGTYGYMSPEYAMEGIFSEKSDVFSFGVILLEIVSGRRNSNFMDEESCSLIGQAWKLWKEDKCWSLVDPTISESNFKAEISRCIQLGLLCVEDIPENRPSITMVVSMIENEGTDFPCPIQPGFIHRRMTLRNEVQQSSQCYSSNHVSVTFLSGR